jgi:hypothetical protein
MATIKTWSMTLADTAGPIGETDVEKADLETVIIDLLDGQYNNRSGLLVSTPPRAGLRMCQRTWPMNCAGDAISSYAISRPVFWISLNAMPDKWIGS